MEAVADLLFDIPKNYGLAFDVVHYIVCLQGERADLGEGFETFTRSNPLASWVSAMMMCFAGALIVNPLCGESPLQALEDPLRIAIATGLWYLMFYSPTDIVYKLSKTLPVKVPLYLIKGMYYPKKIVAGIKHAKHVFNKSNILAIILIATLKANGSGFIKPFARFFRGATENIAGCLETMKPSVTTKYCLICAIAYTFAPGDLTYIIITGLLVTMKAGPLFNIPVDGFSMVENNVMPIVFRKIEEEPAAVDDEKKES